MVLDRLLGIATELTGLDRSHLDPDVPLVELGFDSLVLTQMAQRIKQDLGADLPFRDFLGPLRTFNAIAERVEEVSPSAAGVGNLAPDLAGEVQALSGAPGSVTPEAEVAAVLMGQLTLLDRQLDLLAAARTPGAVGRAEPVLDVGKGGVEGMSEAGGRPPPRGESGEAREKGERSGKAPLTKSPGAGGVEEGLTAHQEALLAALVEEWCARTRGSKELTDRHRPHHADPRTAAGFDPRWKELVYPLVIQRSRGPFLWDVDGNRYVDLLNGFGPIFFGHAPSFIVEAVQRQLESGFEIGPQTPLAGPTAKLLCELTGLHRAAFTCTGSEAVLTAIRVARTFTGREEIALFSGAYHGNFDEVLVRGSPGRGGAGALPLSPGIPRSALGRIRVLDYGTEEALEKIRENATRLAAVLVEPVHSRRPDLQPREFLRELREITRESGAVLIFDEVVTGFRCHPGGAQAIFDVEADLVTYGKVLGGGMPIGVLAGRRPIIDVLDGGPWSFGDDSLPTQGVTFSAGTFVRHPLAIAAAHATLSHLKEEGPSLQEGVNSRTEEMVGRLSALAREAGAPIDVPHFCSIFYFRPTEPRNEFNTLFFHLMRQNGVFVLEGFPSYLTVAHEAEQVDQVVEAFGAAIGGMREMGFWSGPSEVATVRLPVEPGGMDRLSEPPVPGARLGRDRDGSAAWFLEDPERPGAFIRVG